MIVTVSACAHPVGDALRDARSTGLPDDFELIYLEEGGSSLGNDRIRVSGNTVERNRQRPGFTARSDEPEDELARHAADDASSEGGLTQRADLSPTDGASLLELLVELEAWEAQSSERLPAEPMERAQARLRIRIRGETSEISEWVNDLASNDRLIRIKLALESMLQSGPTSE